ncbi:MAG: PAS domain S-box protein [Verrucomicrobia bacterium]|nr:PAS domain S-box protein [Verrucomicrobiota bacterium]
MSDKTATDPHRAPRRAAPRPGTELLTEGERLLQSLLDHSLDAVLLTAPDGRVFLANPAACRMFGRSEEEICRLGRNGLVDITDPRLADGLEERGRKGWARRELTLLRADGTRFAAEVTSATFLDPSGEPRASVIIRDLSDRQRTEEAMSLANEIITHMAEGVFLTRAEDGRIVYANLKLEAMFGYGPDELLGQHVSVLNAPAEKTPEETARDIQWCVERNGGWSGEIGNIRKDGTRFWCYVNVSTFRHTRHGRLWLSIHTDITARRRAEEALQEASLFNHQIISSAQEGIIVAGLDCRYQVWNPFMEKLTGVPAQEVLDRHPLEVFPFLRGTPVLELMEKAMAGETSPIHDFPFHIPQTGRSGWVAETIGPLRDAKGKIIGVIGTVRDITERKRAEEALHSLSAQILRLQDEERRRLARELHDTTAQSLAALMINLSRVSAAVPQTNAAAQQHLALAIELAERCAHEVRTMSYLLHPPTLEMLGLPGALRECADGFAARSGIRVELDLPPDLGRLPQEKELTLFRVLQESLANIHRHSGSTTAAIRLARDEGGIRLEVKDTGRGMFVSGHPASTGLAPGRLGVGIAGMRERLRQLGGRLEIESNSGGTTVKAILPHEEAAGFTSNIEG